MPPVSGSSSPDPKSPVPAELEAGLAAFKRGDYTEAIALLQATPLPPDHPLTAKAQMGLVIAYAKSGEPLQAASLCQSLCQSQNSQLRTWAVQTYTSLAKRYPQVAQLGTIPTAAPSTQTLESETDTTGFMPFDPDSNSPEDSTGFVPLNPTAQAEPEQPEPGGKNPSTPKQSKLNSPTGRSKIHTLRAKLQTLKSAPSAPEVGAQAASAAMPAKQQPPIAQTPIAQPAEESAPYQPQWRQAGRAVRGQSLGRVKRVRFELLHIATAIALFWLVRELFYRVSLVYCTTLVKVPFLNFRYTLFGPPTWSVLIGLVILLVASRWILDGLQRGLYGLEPFALAQLQNYSPEAVRLIQNFCHRRRLPLPALGVLPTSAPVALSYGFLPRTTRIVVSQGLLEQLAEDEIATVYANELGHIHYRTVPLMSLITIVTQVPYTLYWQLAQWGDRQQTPLVRGTASVGAALFYGCYALLRGVGLWFSRQRLYFSDRFATELTGNPNGYIRALLKVAIGTAQDVQKQGKTSYLLEGFDLLTPLGYPMATTLGSVYPYVPVESVLEWDQINPFRQWLAINNAHPPTGSRLNLLALYARHLKLDPELSFTLSPKATVNRQPSQVLTARQWRTLLLQGAPFFGTVLALVIVLGLFLTAWVAAKSRNYQFAWMGEPSLFTGLLMIGFSIGSLIRINRFFPDIKFLSFNNRLTDPSPSLVTLLKNTTTIPLDSLPVRLEGKLLGRSGMANFLGQDLLLQTATGIVRLHWVSRWGPIGNLLADVVRPTDLLNQNLVVTGWFRRGATPWIDVETLRTASGRTSRSDHPVWSSILAIALALLGAFIVARG